MGFPYAIERSMQFPDEPVPVGALMRGVIRERRAILWNDMPAWEAEHGKVKVYQGEWRCPSCRRHS